MLRLAEGTSSMASHTYPSPSSVAPRFSTTAGAVGTAQAQAPAQAPSSGGEEDEEVWLCMLLPHFSHFFQQLVQVRVDAGWDGMGWNGTCAIDRGVT